MNFRIRIISVIFLFILTTMENACGDIKVFDNNNQFIGVLISQDGYVYSPSESQKYTYIFLPIINKAISVGTRNGELFVPLDCYILFSNSDCSGVPYSSIQYNVPLNFIFNSSNRYYYFDGTKEVVIIKSRLKPGDYCRQVDYQNEYFKGIEISRENIPIIFPVAVPLKYNYSTEKVMGDINGDGKIGLEETIYSLEVLSGIRNK